MSLCRYRNALGIPGQGVHRPRVFGMAKNDVVMTFLAAFVFAALIISPFHHFGSYIHMFFIMAITLFGLGIILHRIFCVKTTVDKWLFPDM